MNFFDDDEEKRSIGCLKINDHGMQRKTHREAGKDVVEITLHGVERQVAHEDGVVAHCHAADLVQKSRRAITFHQGV